MNATLWSILAGLIAIACEYGYRKLGGSYWSHIYLWIPAGLIVGYGVHALVTVPKTSLLAAFVTWALTTTVCRVLVCVFVLKDNVTTGTWVAVCLLVLARISQQVWK
jgi:hypothetical protein